MKKRAEEGHWNGGIVFGYDNIDKQLVINVKESLLVKEIFSLRTEGLGYKAIVNRLNERGEVTKKGKAFSISGVKLILQNPVYIGMVKWGEYKDWNKNRRKGKSDPIYVQGVHAPIISQELWEKVKKMNEVQNETYSTNRNFKGELFLTGILKCPQCGAGTVMHKTKMRNGEGYHFYYMCQGYHSKGTCKTNLVKKDVVEQKVLTLISEMVRDKEIVNQIIKKLDGDKQNGFEPLIKELEIYQSKLEERLAKQKKLDKDYFDNNIEASLYSRLSISLQSEIDRFKQKVNVKKQEINRLSNKEDIDKEIVMAALLNFNELFHKATNEEKKMLVRSLIKEVRMERNRKEINKITFWFSSDNALPSKEGGGTLS
ncbi:recombinase family protein [Cytobacillus firmus]|uniref:recombinase family protein n=1 Tax=Cytobacillus firmus TaxID=1399 RepID=UPI0024C181F8|nr:recombinase family protein [Cytobacillus firmus]WHY34215.1 recombinase family protein [Cytobacillus firmus]